MALRIVFMGSPEFAVPSLRATARAGEVVAVVTQPDKPSGRGRKLAAPAVKTVAEELGLPVWQPASVKKPEFAHALAEFRPDLAVVVAYGKILPRAVLDVPRLGCVNVHASLLPHYRGAAPIQWAIMRGETRTGVTLMQLDEGMDTGPMLRRSELDIGPEETAGELSVRLAELGAHLLPETLAALAAGTLAATPQDHDAASYAPLLSKADGVIDWQRPAVEVAARVRGLDPWPVATTSFQGQPLKMWGARVIDGDGAAERAGSQPGTVLGLDGERLVIACAERAVAVAELQLPGKKRMSARALAAGHHLDVGARLGA